jgi:hypothetical protein
VERDSLLEADRPDALLEALAATEVDLVRLQVLEVLLHGGATEMDREVVVEFV